MATKLMLVKGNNFVSAKMRSLLAREKILRRRIENFDEVCKMVGLDCENLTDRKSTVFLMDCIYDAERLLQSSPAIIDLFIRCYAEGPLPDSEFVVDAVRFSGSEKARWIRHLEIFNYISRISVKGEFKFIACTTHGLYLYKVLVAIRDKVYE